MRPLRILIVSPYPIFPAWSGGKVRTVAIARGFVKHGHSVTVLTPMDPRQSRRLCAHEPFRVQSVAYPFLLAYALRDRPFPYLFLASFHPGLRAMLAPLLRDYDVVQFEHAAFAGLVHGVPSDVVTAYDAHNVEFDYLTQECRSRGIADIVGRRMQRLERRLVQRSDRVCVVSDHDTRRFADLYALDHRKAVSAPNGIDEVGAVASDPSGVFRRHPGLERFRVRAVYSGSDVEHNRRAVRFLLDHVVPRAADVGIVFQGGCGRRFAGMCGHSNVFFDHDHRSFHHYAVVGTVGLNPALSGAGTNLKVLNYLAHGVPVVTTPFGMRGYEDFSGCMRVCAVDEFLPALLAGDFPPPPNPAELLERYSWTNIAGRMAAAYHDVIAARDG